LNGPRRRTCSEIASFHLTELWGVIFMKINIDLVEGFFNDEYNHTETVVSGPGGFNLTYSPSEYTVLLPLITGDISTSIIKIAASVLSGQNGNLIILGTIEVPEDESLSTGALPARYYRQFLDSLNLFDEAQTIEIRNLVKVSRRAWDAIYATAIDESCSLLIVPWTDGKSDDSIYGTSIEDVLKNSPVDLVVVKPGNKQQFDKILVPLRGGQQAGLIIDTALAIKRKFNSELTIMRVLPKDASADDIKREEFILRPYLSKRGLKKNDYNLLTECSDDVAGSIRAASDSKGLVIMGAPLSVGSNGSNLGSVTKAVLDNTNATVFVVQSATPALSPAFVSERLAEKTNTQASISEVVDKWFAENTFHAKEFADIEKLIELKQKQGLKISLGLPTLNEEQTIGSIVETIKESLYDSYPLLDEIVVIDSNSTDKTVEVAESYGIPVVNEGEILPEWGSQLGKGCALWKSLYTLKGDIIAWIDTDIKNIHPRFVYGLVGPLIKYPRIKYVKGFYRRPVKVGDQLVETGGGRVTELTARPLFNLFFPELSGIVQPLSGEYAGRRDVLEKIAFYNGYGVETGLLIDILEQFGLNVIGQVDLTKRIHRNQSLDSLSKMSFAIIQVVIDRLERQYSVKLLKEINKTMKLIKHDPDQFYLELKAIEESMKPPMITLPEYREVFNNVSSKYY